MVRDMKTLAFLFVLLFAGTTAQAATIFPLAQPDPFTYANATASWSPGATTIHLPTGLTLAANTSIFDNSKSANGVAPYVGTVSAYNSGTGVATISGAKVTSSGSADALGIGVPQGPGCVTVYYRNALCKFTDVGGINRPVGPGARTDGIYYLSDEGLPVATSPGSFPFSTASWAVGATTISTQAGLNIGPGMEVSSSGHLIGYISNYSGTTITLQTGAYFSGATNVTLSIFTFYGHQYQQIQTGNSPDPDTLDPTVATEAQFETKWCAGAHPCSNANMATFLQTEKGYTSAQTARIFYVQIGGTAATGAACENNPATPCGTISKVLSVVNDRNGGIIIFRGGFYTGGTFQGFSLGNQLFLTSITGFHQYAEPGQAVTGTGFSGTTLTNWVNGAQAQWGQYTTDTSQNIGSVVSTTAASSWTWTGKFAAAAWSLGATTITVSTTGAIGGNDLYDVTKASFVGTVASYLPGIATTATASWSLGATTIQLPTGLVISSGQPLVDTTLPSTAIGTVASYNNVTGVLTLAAPALVGSSGSADHVQTRGVATLASGASIASNGATDSITFGTKTITVPSSLSISAAAVVYDPVAICPGNGFIGNVIGTVTSYSGTTLTYTPSTTACAGVAISSLASIDPLYVGTPENITVGTSPGLDLNPCYNGNTCFAVSGSNNKPLVLMSYPGETVTADIAQEPDTYASYPFQGNVIFDGFQERLFEAVASGGSSPDSLKFGGYATNITIKNSEFMGGDKISFGNGPSYVTVENSVFHENASHTVYFLDGGIGAGLGAPNYNTEVNNLTCRRGAGKSTAPGQLCSAYYANIHDNSMYSNGASGYDPIHLNTYIKHSVVRDNVVAYSGGSPIALQTGELDTSIKNNLMYDNGVNSLTLYLYGAQGQSTNILGVNYENNIAWTGLTSDIIRGAQPGGFLDAYNSSCTSRVSACPGTFLANYRFANNILVVDNLHGTPGSTPTYFIWDFTSNPHTASILNNILGSNNGSPNILTDTIGYIIAGADSMPTTACTSSIVNWAGQVGISGKACTFSQMESLNSGSFFLSNNQYTTPGFTDVSTAYTNSPGKYDFLLTPGNPACNVQGPSWTWARC